MKRADLREYILDNGLLESAYNEPGIYAITIDDYIAYIGQSKDVYRRCAQHIYNIENAAFANTERKYVLLLSARLGRTQGRLYSIEIL